MKDGTPKTNSTGFQPRPNLEENAQLCGIVLATLLIFATPLLLRFCKTLKFAATLAFAGTSSPPVQTDFSQYKSEDDLRKEMGWSDRHWRIAKCQGPYAPLYPNRRAYEESKAKVPQGYELTQVNIESVPTIPSSIKRSC